MGDELILKRRELSGLISFFRREHGLFKGVRLPLRDMGAVQALALATRASLRQFVQKNGLREAFNVTATSGSTQERLLIAHSRACHEAHLVRLARLYRSVGVSSKDLCLNVCAYGLNSGGRMMEAAYKAAGAGVIPWGVMDTPEKLDELVAIVRALRPTVLNAYTNQLFDIFARLRSKHAFRRIIVNGEPLRPAYKAQIECLAGVGVTDHYGAMEVSGLAIARRAADTHMRVFDDGLLLEVLAQDGRYAVTGTGELLVTDLKNTCMPFIRYRLGDRVELIQRRGVRSIRVLGRVNDSVLIDGEVFGLSRIMEALEAALASPKFFAMIKKDERTYQDRVIIYLLPDDMSRASRVLDAFVACTGLKGVAACKAYAGDLPRTSTGKMRYWLDERGRGV